MLIEACAAVLKYMYGIVAGRGGVGGGGGGLIVRLEFPSNGGIVEISLTFTKKFTDTNVSSNIELIIIVNRLCEI